MKFCHVTTFYPPYHFGGDAILVRAMCEALVRRGHQVDVVHCKDAFRLKGGRVQTTPVSTNGVRVHCLHSRLGLLSPLITQQTGRPGLKHSKLRRLLEDDYDVVNFHNVSLIGGPALLKLSQAPVTLYTTHEHWLVCPTHVLWKNRSRPCDRPECIRCSLVTGTLPQLWRYTNLMDSGLDSVGAILAPGQFTAAKHRESGISRPIRVINPFVPRSDQPAARRELSPPSTFVFVGRLVRSKGIEQFLEVAALRPDYRFLIAGEGPLEDGLRQKYGARANIRFLGAVPHPRMQEFYRQAHALVFPSIGPEVFPMSILEAMSEGVPVVVRQAGGSAESVERTGGGLVYRDPTELMPLLDRLATDASLARSLGLRARQGVERHYNEERWMSEYLALVESVRGSRVERRRKRYAQS